MKDPFERRYTMVQHRPPLRPAGRTVKVASKPADSGSPVQLLTAAVSNHHVLRQLQEGIVPAGLLLRYGRLLGNHVVRRLLARRLLARRLQSQPIPGPGNGDRVRRAQGDYTAEHIGGKCRKSHDLSPDTAIGLRISASPDGPAKSAGAGNPGGKPIRYDTGSQLFHPPAAGTTMSQIMALVKAKQAKVKPELGKTATVVGVTPGGDEELFVWNILLQRAKREFWGSEIDAVAAIGPSPKGGGPAPLGQVTVRMDHEGNATAALINRGAVAKPAAFENKAAAKAALVKSFGFSSVSDGSAAWTLEELNKAHAALSRLSSADLAALRGVQLIRDATLADESGNPLAGRFEFSMGLAEGETLPRRTEALRLADSAFTRDDFSFIGGKSSAAAASFHTIIHEAGHAVVGEALREATFAKLGAMGQFNAANAKVNDAVTAFNPEMTSAFAKARRYPGAQQSSCRGFLNALNAATSAIDTFAQGKDASRHAAREAAAAMAIARRDAAKAKVPAGHPALSDFAAAMALQDEWYKAGKELGRARAEHKRAEANEKAEAGAGNKAQSRHLKDFVALVNANKIQPLTDYAKKNWPGHPEEFFAEAYSLWLNDPDYLAAHALPLKEWFDAGGHRQ